MERVELIGQIESQLAGRGELTERRVLDGDGYFIDGHLVVAVMGSDLCVDVGRDDWDATLASDGVRPLLFADLPVPGWVMVDGGSLSSDESVSHWIETSLARR
ncbi:MAG TPA: hypothetical protein VFV13_03105 [Acidimicrobiia bacterium]|nr:hypothetical protein [Acidimicrobiia bacterium]